MLNFTVMPQHFSGDELEKKILISHVIKMHTVLQRTVSTHHIRADMFWHDRMPVVMFLA